MPTITIDLTAEQAQRVAAALGSWKPVEGANPPQMEWVPATMPEARARIVQFLRENVSRYERNVAAEAADQNPLVVP